MKYSKRSIVDPFIVMDVMESARQAEASGKHIIHMEIGQPGTPAPKLAKNFLRKELITNSLGYTVSLGLPELRKKISDGMKKAHKDIQPQALNFGIQNDSLDQTKSKIKEIIEKSKIQPKKNVFESILDNFF